MTYIELTDEQARLLGQTHLVEVRDRNGRVLGYIQPIGFTPEQVEEAKRRGASQGPWYTGEQVREHLRQLEKACERDGITDVARLHNLLDEIRSPEAT